MTVRHAWLEIDTEQFSDNLSKTQQLIGTKKLCAVMKADAYGLGISNLLPTVMAHEVPYIAITSHAELQTIRKHQPAYKGKILRIRTATREEVEAGIALNIEEMIGHIHNAELISDCAVRAGVNINYHLKLNSAGMSRNGLDVRTTAGQEMVRSILSLPNLNLVGLMTHFPKECSQDISDSLAQFQADCDWLLAIANVERHTICIHAANSYAMLSDKANYLDMVRPGSLIYGDGFPPDFEGFPHIFSFKSTIASINDYCAGSSVSYEREHILSRDSRIATVLVGYANGYRRVFSHKGYMLVHGQPADVLGRVSMNVTTIDVTDIPEASIGDEVVIYGSQGQNEVSQAHMETVNQALFADLYTIWGKCNDIVLV